MTISFPHGVAVDATLDGHTVHTDQPAPLGRGDAMSPFDLFFASIGTCMGFYALRFCQERNIPTEGLRIDLDRDRAAKVYVSLQLPAGFPEKYIEAIRRAVDHCAVKRALVAPPTIELDIVSSLTAR